MILTIFLLGLTLLVWPVVIVLALLCLVFTIMLLYVFFRLVIAVLTGW